MISLNRAFWAFTAGAAPGVRVGNESLTFAMLGARVTAVDISPTHLANGQTKAVQLGLDVDFREGDMCALGPGLNGFDLICISGGGICWVPDLDSWARTVHDRPSPDGRVIICEHHPLWETLSVADRSRATSASRSGCWFRWWRSRGIERLVHRRVLTFRVRTLLRHGCDFVDRGAGRARAICPDPADRGRRSPS